MSAPAPRSSQSVKTFAVTVPGLHAEVVRDRERDDRDGRDAEAPADGADRHEALEVAGESHRDGGDRAARDHQERHPAQEERRQPSERLPDVHVATSGLGHHRAELGVRERAGEGDHAAERPDRRAPNRRSEARAPFRQA